jgi:hypothetical protein
MVDLGHQYNFRLMLLFRNTVTFMLVLLLANPACCCSFGDSCTAKKKSVASCCSSSIDQDQSGKNQGDDYPCMCAQNKDYPDFKSLHFQVTDLASEASPPPALLNTSKHCYTPPLILATPIHPPPENTLRILYSIFLL